MKAQNFNGMQIFSANQAQNIVYCVFLLQNLSILMNHSFMKITASDVITCAEANYFLLSTIEKNLAPKMKYS